MECSNSKCKQTQDCNSVNKKGTIDTFFVRLLSYILPILGIEMQFDLKYFKHCTNNLDYLAINFAM